MQTQSDSSLVLAERRPLTYGEVGILTMNRPEQRNPLDKDTIRELNVEVDALLEDPAVRAVIVTGAAPAFSAGGDLRGYLDLYRSEADFKAFLVAIRDLFEKLETSRLFSIAAVNGVCVAGGFEMVLSCDLAVMAEDARMGDAHMKFWQLPGGGGTQRLPRVVGVGLAKRLLYTKQLLTAAECKQWGLVAGVSAPDQLLDDAVALAGDVCAAPESTVATLKGLLRTAECTPLDAGIDVEIADLVSYTSGVESDAYKGLLRFLGPDASPVS